MKNNERNTIYVSLKMYVYLFQKNWIHIIPQNFIW